MIELLEGRSAQAVSNTSDDSDLSRCCTKYKQRIAMSVGDEQNCSHSGQKDDDGERKQLDSINLNFQIEP